MEGGFFTTLSMGFCSYIIYFYRLQPANYKYSFNTLEDLPAVIRIVTGLCTKFPSTVYVAM